MRENSTKKRRLSIKLTQEDWDAIHRKAELSNKNLTDYVTTCCLGKEIVVINDLAEVLREQRGISGNLNQLAMLAHRGRITAVGLTEIQSVLMEISDRLKQILEKRRWTV
ncbi:plasmid mobilization protein [Pygmaiobacter massiliensis]|uniref:plasmid mobilization protein n=1 Tax=Pygmaiobacter massiliensis TaxID=1917873 RepID=UPI002A8210A2|nr:plasmid mobilization relaxosome protein MobC [Pygmaiobacter massiliensis]MDY4784389.1 plasmid mobilization relaxosome protein MobC [Pygmaiobacter massiliensis]